MLYKQNVIHEQKKHYKTYAFCNMLLKMLKKHVFSFVFCTQIAKNLEIMMFLVFFHTSTYKSTADHGREGRSQGQLVTTQVRNPKCKHCLGKKTDKVCKNHNESYDVCKMRSVVRCAESA